jgi:hypothetical protein
LATSFGTTMGGGQIARVTADNPTSSFLVWGAMAIGFGSVVAVRPNGISARMRHVH